MYSFKAFNKDLTCTSGGKKFQYRLGIWNEEPEANCVQNGFHSAANPLDCLNYYRNWDEAVYYIVQLDGDIDEDGTDSKISSTRLKLLKQLTLRQFLEFSILYIADHPFLSNNSWVEPEEKQTAKKKRTQNHFSIVRGKNPRAYVTEENAYICLVQECMESKHIQAYAIVRADGKKYLTDTMYSIKDIDPYDIVKISE